MISPRYYIYCFNNSIEVYSNFRYFKVGRKLQIWSIQQPVNGASTRFIPDLAVILSCGGLPIL